MYPAHVLNSGSGTKVVDNEFLSTDSGAICGEIKVGR